MNPEIHTIRNKKIVSITKTVTKDKHLICFEKDSLKENFPSERTVMTKDHLILWGGNMIKAAEFVKGYENVKNIKYKGEILYNVLLEKHDTMIVNNLICETLDPINRIAKLYKILPLLSEEERVNAIKLANKYYNKKKYFQLKIIHY
jgi:hypothetical protein